MSKRIIWAALLFGALAMAADTTLQTNKLRFGLPSTGNKILQFVRSTSATQPSIRWNEGTTTLQFSNDGTTFTTFAGASVFRNFIDGFQTSTAGGSKVMTIGAGSAYDVTNTNFIELSSTFTKTIASTFTAGSGNGGLDTGAVAAGTVYHIFVIKNPTTNAVDILFSLSPSAPTMPSGFTLKRRVMTMFTDGGSNWTGYFQRKNTIYLAGVSNGFFSDNQAAVSNTTVTLASVPTGINVKVIGTLGITGSNANAQTGFGWLASIGQSAPPSNTTTVGNTTTERTDIMASGGHTAGESSFLYHQNTTFFELWTNTSAQLALTAGATASNTAQTGNVNIRIRIIGWEDPRGLDGLP